MKITDEARDFIKQVLVQNSKNGIRLYFSGYGWGGPSIGLALDEPELEDKLLFINEIQVALDRDLEEYTVDLVLDFDHYRGGLILSGNDYGC